jgi:gamma-glutamylaminecyclotransferase
MTRALEIREVTGERDWLARIGRLRVEVWRSEGPIDEARFREGVWVDEFDAKARHWVGVDGAGEVVAAARLSLHRRLAESPDGYVWLDAGRDVTAPVANVAKLVVARRARRRGLALALNRVRLEAARELGAATATVTASPINARLLAAHEGFTFSGLRVQFADRPGATFHALELAFGEVAPRIFVYGTLLRGERNHPLLAQARFLGEAITQPSFELANLGRYPAMVPGGDAAIAGEVYEVDAVTLAALDALEEHPDYYRRTKVALADGELVEAYLLDGELVRGRPRIPAGDWRRG